MARVFLSYSSRDVLAAMALQQWLTEQDPSLRYDIFRDKDPNTGIAPGERWREALRQASSRCEFVVCLGSSDWQKSPICRQEYDAAEFHNKRILLMRLERFEPDPETAKRNWVDLFGGPSTEISVDHEAQQHTVRLSTKGLEYLRKVLVRTDNSPYGFPWPPLDERERCPYRGGASFEEVDAGVFFAREVEREHALGQIHRMRSADQGIFVIRGQAGCGKSSFLRAGVLPRLRRDDRDFTVLGVVSNVRHPLSGPGGMIEVILTAARQHGLPAMNPADLLHQFQSDPGAIDAQLARIHHAATTKLLGLADGAKPPALVVAIDQMDSLFASDSDEPAAFLELIGRYARDGVAGSIPLILLLSIRTSAYETFTNCEKLAGTQTAAQHLEPINSRKFIEVVRGPASRSTDKDQPLHLENEFVEHLLADAAVGADPLPLLSLTLARLWQLFGQDGALRLSEYERMGRMGEVIRQEIDEALAVDPVEREEQLTRLHRAFVPSLATVDPDTQDPVARRAALAELRQDSQSLIEVLIERRLLATPTDDTVELASNQILAGWPDLHGWLRDARAELASAEALKHEAAKWEEAGRDKDVLLRGRQLEAAESALQSQFAEWVSPAEPFVKASRKRAVDRRRTARGLQIAGAVLLIVCILGGVAFWQWRESARLARALELVTQAEQMLDGSIPGGDIRAMQLLLAAHSLGVTNVEGVASQRNDLIRIMELPVADNGEVVGVNDVAVSPDGNLVAAATADHHVKVWQAHTGEQPVQLSLDGHGEMQAIAFSDDGELIAAGGDDGKLRVWNAKTGIPQQFSELPGQMITSVAFSPSGRTIAAGTADGVLRLWDTKTGDIRAEPRVADEGRAVRSVAFKPRPRTIEPTAQQNSDDGDVLVTGDDFGRVQLWDADLGRPLSEPLTVDNTSNVLSVAFGVVVNEAGENYRLAAGMLDGRIHVFNAPDTLGDGRFETDGSAFSAHPGFVHKLAFSPGGTRIVSGGSDNSVRVWDAATHQPIGNPLLGHHGAVSSVTFDPEGTRIVSGSQDGSVRVWDAIGGLPIPAGQGSEVRAVAFRPGFTEAIEREGGQMASGGTDSTVKLWNPETGATVRQLGFPTDTDLQDSINTLAYSPNGRQLVTGSVRGNLELWNLDELPTGERIVPDSFARHAQARDSARISSVAFSPDGETIATGQWDGNVQLWDARTLQPVQRATKLPYQVWSVAYSPVGDYVASGSGDAVDRDSPTPHEIRLWTADDMSDERAPLAGPSDSIIYSLSFNSAGDVIASGSADGTIQLWEVETGNTIGSPLSGDQNTVMALGFAHEGPLMASGSADGKVRLWNTATRQLVGTPVSGHQKWVHGVAFSPQDDWIVSGGADGNLRLWPVIQDVSSAICDRIGTSMNRADWRRLVAGNNVIDEAALPYRDLCAQETDDAR